MKAFLKFLVSSGISCLVDLGLFRVLEWIFGTVIKVGSEIAVNIISTAGARIVSSIVNYLINRKAVFKSDSRKSVIRYYILAACQLLVSALLVTGVSELIKLVFGLNMTENQAANLKTVVKGFVDFGLFFVSFKIQKEWVFKK